MFATNPLNVTCRAPNTRRTKVAAIAGELSGASSGFQIRKTPNIESCIIFLLLTGLLSSGCDILLKARGSYQS